MTLLNKSVLKAQNRIYVIKTCIQKCKIRYILNYKPMDSKEKENITKQVKRVFKAFVSDQFDTAEDEEFNKYIYATEIQTKTELVDEFMKYLDQRL